jgi:hypothetical protein
MQLNEKTIKINYYFSSDMKMSLIMLGLSAANSNYPCYICKIHKSELHLIKEKNEQHLRKLDDYKNEIGQYGIKSSPIITFIPNFYYVSNIPYIYILKLFY